MRIGYISSSSHSHFRNKQDQCKTFLVKMSMRIKNNFHINDLALSLALKKGLGQLENGLLESAQKGLNKILGACSVLSVIGHVCLWVSVPGYT